MGDRPFFALVLFLSEMIIYNLTSSAPVGAPEFIADEIGLSALRLTDEVL